MGRAEKFKAIFDFYESFVGLKPKKELPAVVMVRSIKRPSSGNMGREAVPSLARYSSECDIQSSNVQHTESS